MTMPRGEKLKVRVNVLLATYNGSEFLRGQLDSIESQTLPVSRITMRDDGSTDNTLSLLEEWAPGRSRKCLLRGPRLGVTNNFFALLASADEDSEYFAFCDQDDVWLPDKIERAVLAIQEFPTDKALVYCSRVELVDENLKHLGFSPVPKHFGYVNALVENVATGCTMVLNRTARNLICEGLPQRALFHDWWCYLVIAALGRVVFDETPTVKYRQHANNHVGATASRLEFFKRRLESFFRQGSDGRRRSDQAVELQRCFGDRLSARDREILGRFLSVRGGIRQRVSYSVAMDVWRQSRFDTALLRVMILMGRV
jgi:glycosyltransferase involved in cell wall biosynthesis